MKERLLKAANVLLMVLSVVLLGTLQSSFWFQVFGYIPAPALWIPALIYVAIFKTSVEAMIVTALFGFALSSMTSMSDGLLLSAMYMVTIGSRLFRKRIYWSSNSYIMMLCGFSAVFFHIFYWMISLGFEQTKLTSPEIIDWIAEGLLTCLFAPTLFALFIWIDRVTGQEDPSSTASTDII